jgi:hypothetical protein
VEFYQRHSAAASAEAKQFFIGKFLDIKIGESSWMNMWTCL